MAKKGGNNALAWAVLVTGLLLTAGGALTFMKYHGLFGELGEMMDENGFPDLPSLKPDTVKISDADTWVEFIDVGQADCALVCSEGHYMLIDTGDRDDSDMVIAHLDAIGVEKLDYMILSHPHADHIGEAADIYDSFEVGSVIMPQVPEGLEPDSVTYEMLTETVPYIEPAADMSFTFGECTFDTYAAHEYTEDLNDMSVIVRLVCGDCSFLFTGDCGENEEREMLDRGVMLDSDVLKAGHHGSAYSSCEEWLSAVTPKYTVISCGAFNEYGHPDEAALKRLDGWSDEVFITSRDGSIVFETDGKDIAVIR